ncbi:MAG TPA: RNA polymerase sigma factor [Kofleriaceae bacterium]|jgi:RNA polymerase sigma factor (sigma-70 family)|nr:RNA polymerase sigma factor [Kofleriaceae bacterium]
MDTDAELVDRARAGERAALDELVRATKDLVFNLAVRMLGSVADAEDATQEILIKIVTHLASFRGDSAFRTWAYRVAANHLLTTRKRGAELRVASFEQLGEALDANLVAGDRAVDDQLLVREAKLICTSMMLACLDRDHRLAFVLGEIFEFASDEGAAVLEISSDAFRKRLSRARERMAAFMGAQCGLADPRNACRCAKQAGHAVAAGQLDPRRLAWGPLGCRPAPKLERVADIDSVARAIEVFRSNPNFVAPEAVLAGIKQVLGAGSSDLLS